MNGVLLIDKESGVTSHDVVDRLRRLLKIKAIGHGGTLDPLATGLLICLVGEATKLSQYVMAEEKSYLVGVKLGIQTDSGDITGQVIAEKKDFEVSLEKLDEALLQLKGELRLSVPKYSAVKVKGRKLYEYARANEDVAIPVKTMTIHRNHLLEYLPEEKSLTVEIDCEKGTYVRSWVEKLGEILGCGATVESLRRTRSGSFTVAQGQKTDELSLKEFDQLPTDLIPLAEVLGHWPALKVQGRDHSLLVNGQIPKSVFSQVLHFDFPAGVRVLDSDGALLALIVRDEVKGIKLARVFAS